MKPLQLGINYGMGVPSLGARARSPSADRQRHHRAAQATLSALLAVARRHGRDAPCWSARSRASFGWPLHISTSPNKRTLYNFPMQRRRRNAAAGGWRLCEAGIVPIMLIHDGILFEETDRGADRARHGDHACGRPRGLRRLRDRRRHRSEAEGGARYRDKRPMAQKMWATIMNALQAIGALPRKEVA